MKKRLLHLSSEEPKEEREPELEPKALEVPEVKTKRGRKKNN